MLNGYKTYIVSGIVLLIVIAEKILGFDIPGAEVGEDWLTMVVSALGLGALRNGMK